MATSAMLVLALATTSPRPTTGEAAGCVDLSLMQLALQGQQEPAPPGYTQNGTNCDCGRKVAEWSEQYTTATLCSLQCLKYPACKSFGIFTAPSFWAGHCRLYDAACTDTCPSPQATGIESFGYNKDESFVPPVVTLGACSVPDGSDLSSGYPCDCGSSTCFSGETCDSRASQCTLAQGVTVDFPRDCGVEIAGRKTFVIVGNSASGAPVYSNGQDAYIYYDPYCNGDELQMSPQWIIDSDAPNMTATADLDNDGTCSDFAHIDASAVTGVASGTQVWQVACTSSAFENRTVTVKKASESDMATPAPTSVPTLEPGKICQCEPCGSFPLFDLDADGCVVPEEAEKVGAMQGRFREWDTNGDGCINKTECAIYTEANNPDLPTYSIGDPPECDYGYYVPEGASVCLACSNGSTRRRRSNLCTACDDGEFDGGEYDDCIGGVYMTADVPAGSKEIPINDPEGLMVRDAITVATRNPGHFEQAIIVGFGSIILDHELQNGFKRYDSIIRACDRDDGRTYSNIYPCGCGKEICPKGWICNKAADGDLTQISSEVAVGTSGVCVEPGGTPPTPAPTVSAKGDPHLVNLQGEHFDVNHGGDFVLLRIPQNTKEPAAISLKAQIAPEHGKPCTTYITKVELTGSWFGNKRVEVRSYLQSHSLEEEDKFLGIRVMDKPGEGSEAKWENISDYSNEDQLVATSEDGYEVKIAKTQWVSKKNSKVGAPGMAGQFVFYIQNTANPEAAKVIVRQDLPYQEHLNVAIRRLSALGRVDVGGLLGFDAHPESLEEVTAECLRHRDGLDNKKGPHKPAWKTRWSKIREERANKQASSDKPGDNEAAASLRSKDLDVDEEHGYMCVCPSKESLDDFTQEQMQTEFEIDGVITEFQTARLAEASWD